MFIILIILIIIIIIIVYINTSGAVRGCIIQYNLMRQNIFELYFNISRVDNAFLVSLVGLRPEKYFWLGLSNQKNIDEFVWTKGNTVKFTHWNTGMPGMEKCQFSLSIKGHKQQLHNSHVTIFFPSTTQGYTQGCVAMTTGILAGLWDLLPCTNRSKYICKHLAEGAVPTVPVPTQSPPKCAQGWNRVGTRNFCAKVQPELSVTQLNIHTRGW